MAPKIRNVAIAGATGNVGTQVLKALLHDKFNVTVLARKASSFPESVTVKIVDFSSLEALTKALKGQDAFVDTTLIPDDTPQRLVDAAAAAGVYRYIPSDFSLDLHNRKVHTLPVFYKKEVADKHLMQKAKETGMTWSVVCNGAFLDWNLRSGFMNINLHEKKVNLLNDGNNVIVWTTLGDTGKAVSAILLHQDETENRPVYIHSIIKSQKQVADLAKEALGSEGWETTSSDMEKVLENALKEFHAGNYGWNVFGDMIRYANSRSDYSTPWEKDDSQLLGLQPLSDDEVKELIKQIAAEKKSGFF